MGEREEKKKREIYYFSIVRQGKGRERKIHPFFLSNRQKERKKRGRAEKLFRRPRGKGEGGGEERFSLLT